MGVVELVGVHDSVEFIPIVAGVLGRAGIRSRLIGRAAADAGHIRLSVETGAVRSPAQGYRLRVNTGGIRMIAASEAGFRHAAATLAQLLRCGRPALPAMTIEDWPDFEQRGVMLDISRDKVPTMATLRALVDRFAAWKLNELQLYTEHTFAYRGHERVWRGASPMTPAQICSLDAYCRERGIELVPNQNALGHMERWLKHEPYRRLAECTGSWTLPWGEVRSQPSTLCPLDVGSLALIEDLYAQLLPNFSSRRLNVGCDEPWELGQGRSRSAFARRGEGRVYLDWLLKVRRAAARHGRRIQFWSDWIQKHPELIARLPRDVTPMVWGYEAEHPFDRECRYPRDAGLRFYVCPGTSSWCSFGGRTENALANLRNAAKAGMRHGAAGYLMTDWGDYGHRQYLPVSVGPLVYGAGCAWCGEANAGMDVAALTSRHAFDSAEARAAEAWLELGRVSPGGKALKNQTRLFRVMQRPVGDAAAVEGLTRRSLDAVEARLSRVERLAVGARYPAADGAIMHDELSQTIRVLRHAVERARCSLGLRGARGTDWLARDLAGIVEEHRRLWRLRNRPGGLRSSVSYYLKMVKEYERFVG